MSKYDDIIDHPHFQSKDRPHMSMHDRAAQFSPFAALVGFDAAVEETGRLTEEKITLDGDRIAEINAVIQTLSPKDTVHLTYFLPDLFKSGGMYLNMTGILKNVDSYEGVLKFVDGTDIPISDIFAIEKGE